MTKKTGSRQPPGREKQPANSAARPVHARIVASPQSQRYLDPVQLTRLEESFRTWVKASPRADVRLSRQRLLLIFLLIRYTGARLHEVLAVDPARDVDLERQAVVFGRAGATPERPPREVQIPAPLVTEMQGALADPDSAVTGGIVARGCRPCPAQVL